MVVGTIRSYARGKLVEDDEMRVNFPLAAMVMSAVNFVSLPIYGLYAHDFMGYVAFSLVVSCIFSLISIVSSYFCDKNIYGNAVNYMIFMYIFVLVVCLLLGDGGVDVLIYCLLILGAPLSLPVVIGFGAASGHIFASRYGEIAVLWAASAAVAYLQWCVLFRKRNTEAVAE